MVISSHFESDVNIIPPVKPQTSCSLSKWRLNIFAQWIHLLTSALSLQNLNTDDCSHYLSMIGFVYSKNSTATVTQMVLLPKRNGAQNPVDLRSPVISRNAKETTRDINKSNILLLQKLIKFLLIFVKLVKNKKPVRVMVCDWLELCWQSSLIPGMFGRWIFRVTLWHPDHGSLAFVHAHRDLFKR